MNMCRLRSAFACAICGVILSSALLMPQFAAAQVRTDGNANLPIQGELAPVRGVLFAPVVVSTGDYPPAAQRLVVTQAGYPLCSSSVNVLSATFAAPAQILLAGGVIVPRGTSVMEISFDGLTQLRSGSGVGQAQVDVIVRVRESVGPGAWVISDYKRSSTVSGVAGVAPSLVNYSMWSPLGAQAFVGVTPGLAYDVEVVAYYAPASPHTYNANFATVCNGRLVVGL